MASTGSGGDNGTGPDGGDGDEDDAATAPSHVRAFLTRNTEFAVALQQDDDGVLEPMVDIMADALSSLGMSTDEFADDDADA